MTQLARATAEGGTSGNAVAAGSSGSGTPFDTVVNTGGVITYDGTHIDFGSLAYRVAMASAVCRLTWTSATLGTLTELYFAGDYYFTGSPTSSCHFAEGVTSAAGQAWAIDVASTGKLFIRNSANTNIYTSTNALPVNQWCRVEVHVVAGTTGTIQVRIYAGLTDTNPLEDSGAITTNTGSDTSSLYLGALTSSTALPAYWMGELRVGDAAGGWLGPATSSYTAAAAMVSGSALTAAASPAAGAAMSSASSLASSPAATLAAGAGMSSASSLTGAPTSRITALLLTPGPRWIAHRCGFASTLGEFTLEAAAAALAQYSRSLIELSLRQCSTGEWVAIHDATTGRTHNGPSVTVSATPWTTLQGYTTINGGNRMRQLTDFLDAFPDAMFVIDNKQDTNAAALIAILQQHAPGRWMGKQQYTAAQTWLAACQNAGVPIWAFFYPGDLGNLASTYASLSAAKGLILFGFGDYSAAPVPTQSDAATFFAFTVPRGIQTWAHILGTSTQRSTADSQAAGAGATFDGYMTSGFATLAPTDSTSAGMVSGSVFGGVGQVGEQLAAGMVSGSVFGGAGQVGEQLAAGMVSVSVFAGDVGGQSAGAGMISTAMLSAGVQLQETAAAALTSSSALAGGITSRQQPAAAGMVSASQLAGTLAAAVLAIVKANLGPRRHRAELGGRRTSAHLEEQP